MDNESRKRAAELDADEALDAILREIDSADRRKPSAADEIAAEIPRRSSRPDSGHRSTERRRPESAERSRPESRPVSHAKEEEPAARTEEPAERQQKPVQRHRLPAAAERPEERSQRLAAERARNAERSEAQRPVRRQPAERPQRPAERPAERMQRPAERPAERMQRAAERPAERMQRAAERPAERMQRPERPEQNERPARPQRPERPQRSAANGVQEAGTVRQKRPAQQRSNAAVKRKPSAWRIGMALYIIIFLLVTMFLMHKLWVYLGEYESSLPQYTIDGYVSGLNSGFYTDMVRQHVDEIQTSDYETPDTIAETLDVDDMTGKTYTWAKNPSEYTDENPCYYIRCGEAAIATVKLERVGGTEEYDFPVWKACPAYSLIDVSSEPAYSLDLTIPEGASVMINGIAVPAENLETGVASSVELDDAAKNFAEVPSAQHFAISGLFAAPKVQAYDSLGNPLTADRIPDKTEYKQVFNFGPKAETSPDEELVDRVEQMMREYIDYMVNKDETLDQNLAALDHYLVYQSNAYQKLHSMRGDIYWNNPYTNRVDRALIVSNVRMYSENVFTCDVHYDYQLTMNVVNDYIGDMRWTFVKTGDGWKASDFEITGSNDTKFENDDETAPAQEG